VAQTVADETVDLRARVEGILQKAPFAEGSQVRKGQVLFEIEPDRYRADLQKAKAQLTKAETDLNVARQQEQLVRAKAGLSQAQANLVKATQDVERYRPLAAERAVPQESLDSAIAGEKVAVAAVEAAEATLRDTELSTNAYILEAEAAVEAAKAAVTAAELNLSYTTVASPISGQIGRKQVDVGNLVGRGDSTILATVSNSDPIRAEFSISEADFLKLATRIMQKGERAPQTVEVPAELILSDGSVYPHRGRLRSVERALDLLTGTLPVEIEFPNPDRFLRPGQFARVRVVIEERENAVLVPQVAVVETQGTRSVWVVDSGNKVTLKPITASERVGNSYIVTEGLEGGEKVIVQGVQKLRPGATVSPISGPAAGQPGR